MKKVTRDAVKEFYARAAAQPQAALCCTESYNDEDTAHIPKEVLDISYGCGSPVALAGLKEGETVLDLGCGGGIDCFVASRKVGRSGMVIGVDMTDEMLERAKGALVDVARNLGYSNLVFKKGFLEEIPLDDSSVDVVLSNCVVNLSDDKPRVMSEVMRVLKDRGRFCISDIVAEKDVPEDMRADRTLWGECISGALREEEFLDVARKAGAYGLEIRSRSLYRVVEGIRFYSITLEGRKFVKGPECVYRGHYAIYNGPFRSVRDDDGHEYPAGVPVEICTDTLEKLTSPPYDRFFTIVDAEREEPVGCAPSDTAGGGCC